ncbi:Mitochondrial pyruvate carrier 2 [Parelaphostrongylus tenuis]|uniref:Mitochondrial pyruvate carrier n=1 Tax=Parelaphostrongylus tenuis TaxID=148309 RepID=A0AAD5RDU2_PARTN|nr:Mitochondrial pyruvate carrier 2 [Parelaphostrongylus tenuis]
MGPHKVLYNTLCRIGDKVVYPLLPAFAKPAWNHAAGPKTVFFWAPTIKWALVVAGLADLTRPANKLSLYQNCALFATGAIWSRYCLVIVPVNYYLCSVNFFVMCTGLVQLCRIGNYRYNNPDWEQQQHHHVDVEK